MKKLNKTAIINKVLVIAIAFLMAVFTAKSQTGTLQGKISDEDTLEAIPYAVVSVDSGNAVIKGISDIDGNFKITSIPAGKHNIKVTYIGYETKEINDVEIKSGLTTFLDIKMKTAVMMLREVVMEDYMVRTVDASAASMSIVVSPVMSGSTSYVQSSNISYSKAYLNNSKSDPAFGLITKNVQSSETLEQGKLTASELNDFGKWELWKDIKETDLKEFQELWQISPVRRYAVQVKANDGKPVADAVVLLKKSDGKTIWSSRTDNTGKAELWANLFDKKKTKAAEIVVVYEGKEYKYEDPTLFSDGINVFKLPTTCNVPDVVDIAFVVDATGSMDDEIKFLQSDLVDIIQKTKTAFPDLSMNLGSVFYRCWGNSYATKFSQFAGNIDNTVNFIKAQNSGEGGDEIVEEAFRVAVDSLNWSKSARARLLFFVMDEQPLVKPEVLELLRKNIEKAAEKGIRVIPIIASAETMGHASSLEYLMRSIALATNGTYVFLTDHSKIGDAHAKPTTDQYDVEMLNALLRRVIYQYCYIPRCDEKPDIKDISDTSYFSNSAIIAHEIIDASRSIKDNPAIINLKDFTAKTAEDSIKYAAIRDSLAAANTGRTDSLTVAEKIEIKFFPNPTSGPITVLINGKIKELLLTDISGKLIAKYNTAKETRMEIDLSQYSTGIYFLRFCDNGKWFSSKVVLMR